MADQTTQQQTNQQDQQTNQQTDQRTDDNAKFTQADIDRIVQDRLTRDRAKYSDYDDLVKFKQEHEKNKTVQEQQQLEEQKQYEKLKEGWQQKENEYQSKLSEATKTIQSERVNNALNQEILKQNAYPEAVTLLKSMAKYNDDGSIVIRGKDANGMESDLTIEQGVEQFLKEKPYLVRGSGQGGAGTGGAGGSGENNNQNAQDLGKQLQDAMAVGDRKLINELKTR